jgi:hypothetical protein
LRNTENMSGPGIGVLALYCAMSPQTGMRAKSLSSGHTVCCTAPPTFCAGDRFAEPHCGLQENQQSANIQVVRSAWDSRWEAIMVILRTWSTGIATLTIWFSAASAQSLDSLYEAAKKEAVLVVVGGGPAPPYEKFAQEFMQRYAGIAVTVSGGPSNVHAGFQTTRNVLLPPARRSGSNADALPIPRLAR